MPKVIELRKYLVILFSSNGAFLMAQMTKNLPVIQETPVHSLGREEYWRREWQPTPVFLPRKLHGRRNLVGYSPWGHKESDTTE